MKDAGLSVWQTLPLGPTHADGSPYHCLSVHAISPRLIDPSQAATPSPSEREKFIAEQAHWLNDYTLYQALRETHQHQPWWEWPTPLRDRDSQALKEAKKKFQQRIDAICVEQYVVLHQWQQLRAAARERGILLFGDMPIFVALDSAEVWAHRDCFKLDESGRPTVVAGVPPDYFSA